MIEPDSGNQELQTKAPSSLRSAGALHIESYLRRIVAVFTIVLSLVAISMTQTRRRPRNPSPPQTQAPRRSAAKYSAFLHSSDKHKSLACNACHKIPTAWTANREFPDVADFPDHNACVRCHRQQFFTRTALVGTGPAICTVCHVQAAPRADARFAFGSPNNSKQSLKGQARQFAIEFPHDRHQNVIASLPRRSSAVGVRVVQTAFRVGEFAGQDKVDYNNCSLCHATNRNAASVKGVGETEPLSLPVGTFKTTPHSHDACFNCHWKNEKPTSAECNGCHKATPAFQPPMFPSRISAKFVHEGGKGEHVLECTTCHINITRAATLRRLTPDVPVAACVACHSDNKKTTYPKVVTIQEELAQNSKSGQCTYCHTADVGRKKPPPSHEAAAQ